ncbi:hypothetical protein [Legionella sp. W05-934-2]|uniref:hypothetical protein n=1 Tax=Legionella sp. W05-934-2 TaxID=1198649 RepID=UPI003461808B
MQTSSIQSIPSEFEPWRAPHLLSNQFQLLAKLINALNAQCQPEIVDDKLFMTNEWETKVIEAFSHPMMPSWIALAKSYYPFYKINDNDKVLIESLEHKLAIKTADFQSLSTLIKAIFLSQYPKVNSQYQTLIDNLETALAKLTAVALTTPRLINDAHQYDKKQFEEAGPSMSSSINPIETILRHLMGLEEADKSIVIAASALLIQVKEVKSHFAQLSLMQMLENSKKDAMQLQQQLAKAKHGELTIVGDNDDEDFGEAPTRLLQSWQSKKEQQALITVNELQNKISQYYDHLTQGMAGAINNKKAYAKIVIVTRLKKDLEETSVLPSLRIALFERHLKEAKKQLAKHRDPIWVRFLRDCLRILLLAFSGLAIYRTLTNQPVNFFKPSHGQRLVEEALQMAQAQFGEPFQSLKKV